MGPPIGVEKRLPGDDARLSLFVAGGERGLAEVRAGKVAWLGNCVGAISTVFEAPAVIACLDYVVVLGGASEQRGGALRIAEGVSRQA